MDRMTRSPRGPAAPALLGVLLAAVLAATCDNPIDIVSEVRREVMLANDRFLELESIDATYMSAGVVSPSVPLSVRFDRALDAASLDGVTLSIGAAAQPVHAEVEGSVLRVREDPFYQNAKSYTLRITGLRGLDGTTLADPVEWFFTTGTAPAGSFVMTGPGASEGYTNNATVSVVLSVNLSAKYYYLSNTMITDPSLLAMNAVTGRPMTTTHTLASTTNGVQTVYLVLADDASPPNFSPVITATVVCDTVAPTVSSVTNTYDGYAINQSYLRQGAYTFTATVANTGSGVIAPIKQVQFYKDVASGVATTLVATDTTAAYTWAWDTTADAEGTWYVKAIATDAAGNVSGTSSNARYLDKTAPTLTAFSVEGDATPINKATPTYTASYSGTTSRMRFWAYDVATGTQSWSDYLGIAVSGTVTNVPAGEGTKQIRMWIYDNAGNYSYILKSYVYDSIPPSTPSLSATTGFYDTTPTWSWTTGGGGNGTFEYSLDGAGGISTTATSFTPGTALDETNHTLTLKERDAAGNWSPTTSRSVRVTQVLPYDGQTGVPRTPTLQWRNAGVTTYYVEGYDPATHSWVTVATVGKGLTSYAYTTVLPASTQIQWRVRYVSGITYYIPSSAGARFTTALK